MKIKLQKYPLHHGTQKIESARGSSSPQHQPFFALALPQTDEFHGEVFGFHLIYSGNFVAEAGTAREFRDTRGGN